MRQQYHSRQTDKGRFIWDVHKLIAKTKNFPVKNIPLSAIKEIEENYWFDGHWPIPTIRNIAEHAKLIYAADLNYPIILSADGRIMDGMHRVCKALIEKCATIKAVQFETEPPPDFIDVDIGKLPHDDVEIL